MTGCYYKLMKLNERQYLSLFHDFLTQYVDKCNVEYLKTDPEKRPKKLYNIANRLIKHPQAYANMLVDFHSAASELGRSVHEIGDARIKYPEDIGW